MFNVIQRSNLTLRLDLDFLRLNLQNKRLIYDRLFCDSAHTLFHRNFQQNQIHFLKVVIIQFPYLVDSKLHVEEMLQDLQVQSNITDIIKYVKRQKRRNSEACELMLIAQRLFTYTMTGSSS